MRILVVSDIHANLIAFEAVLATAGEVDGVWCLGDVVGYGPSPNECIQLVQEQPNLICLQGNHDAAAIGSLPLVSFNPEARQSIDWLQGELNEEGRAFLEQRPQRQQFGAYTLVHASPRQPILEYLLDAPTAAENFSYFNGDFCLVGHTHMPAMFKQSPILERVSLSVPEANNVFRLQARCIVNPGSVGQPRDRDPRAAFAILDVEKDEWDYRRVEYDVAKVQQKMEAAGLPERHITRLESGW